MDAEAQASAISLERQETFPAQIHKLNNRKNFKRKHKILSLEKEKEEGQKRLAKFRNKVKNVRLK